MELFRELRARKATFGFEVSINVATFLPIARAVENARNISDDVRMEMKINMGHGDVKIYTDDAAAADYLRKVQH